MYSQTQMESIFKIYFSKEKEDLLSPESLQMMNGFMEFCKVKDIINNTDYVYQIKQIYSSNDQEGDETSNKTFMSSASRYRFKKSIFELFKKYLSNKRDC